MKNAQEAEKPAFRAFSFTRKSTGRSNDTGPDRKSAGKYSIQKNTFAKEKKYFFTR